MLTSEKEEAVENRETTRRRSPRRIGKNLLVKTSARVVLDAEFKKKSDDTNVVEEFVKKEEKPKEVADICSMTEMN